MRVSETGDMAAAAVPLPANSVAQGAIAVLRHGSKPFDAGELGALADAREHVGGGAAQRRPARVAAQLLLARHRHARDRGRHHLGFHRGHGQRVAQLANRLGRRLGLGDQELSRLHFAALLHDVGMLKIEASQQMTRGRARSTACSGTGCCRGSGCGAISRRSSTTTTSGSTAAAIRTGSPGTAIPRESRIIALCDAVDSMTSDDSYRTPLGLDAALAELERCSGSQFDPELVAAFRELARDGLIEIGPPPGVRPRRPEIFSKNR
jgi:hypothetical protein